MPPFIEFIIPFTNRDKQIIRRFVNKQQIQMLIHGQQTIEMSVTCFDKP